MQNLVSRHWFDKWFYFCFPKLTTAEVYSFFNRENSTPSLWSHKTIPTFQFCLFCHSSGKCLSHECSEHHTDHYANSIMKPMIVPIMFNIRTSNTTQINNFLRYRILPLPWTFFFGGGSFWDRVSLCPDWQVKGIWTRSQHLPHL